MQFSSETESEQDLEQCVTSLYVTYNPFIYRNRKENQTVSVTRPLPLKKIKNQNGNKRSFSSFCEEQIAFHLNKFSVAEIRNKEAESFHAKKNFQTEILEEMWLE